MHRFAFLFMLLYTMSAAGRTLHYGSWSVPLTTAPMTKPALHIKISDSETVYGALFADTPAQNTLHIMHGGTEYRLMPWCEAGTYMPAGGTECIDCGYGHYCTGGRHRAPCTGGAIACNGMNATADATAPADMVNRPLTGQEATTYLPTTTTSNWRQVACCNNKLADPYNTQFKTDNSVMYRPDAGGCPIGQLGPGTYLFITNSGSVCPEIPDAFTAHVAVIDRPSSYKQLHAENYFYTYVDTNSTAFTSYTFRVSNSYYCSEIDNSNISDIDSKRVSRGFMQCLYELD